MDKVLQVPAPLKALLLSRKFWLAVLGVIAALVMYIQGAITPEQLVDAIITLVGLVIGAIAIEDGAGKLKA